jgi:sister-chromatid-cohesion protein PDS5
VFGLFVRQLKYLNDRQSGYATLYLYLLESLATVKSAVLVLDLQDSDALILEFFQCFFDLIRQVDVVV